MMSRLIILSLMIFVVSFVHAQDVSRDPFNRERTLKESAVKKKNSVKVIGIRQNEYGVFEVLFDDDARWYRAGERYRKKIIKRLDYYSVSFITGERIEIDN